LGRQMKALLAAHPVAIGLMLGVALILTFL
jgi:hypothetical protein